MGVGVGGGWCGGKMAILPPRLFEWGQFAYSASPKSAATDPGGNRSPSELRHGLLAVSDAPPFGVCLVL